MRFVVHYWPGQLSGISPREGIILRGFHSALSRLTLLHILYARSCGGTFCVTSSTVIPSPCPYILFIRGVLTLFIPQLTTEETTHDLVIFIPFFHPFSNFFWPCSRKWLYSKTCTLSWELHHSEFFKCGNCQLRFGDVKFIFTNWISNYYFFRKPKNSYWCSKKIKKDVFKIHSMYVCNKPLIWICGL